MKSIADIKARAEGNIICYGKAHLGTESERTILALCEIIERQQVALVYYKQFSYLPEDAQMKDRIGGGLAYICLKETDATIAKIGEV